MTIEINGKSCELSPKNLAVMAVKGVVGYSGYKMMTGAVDLISTLPCYGDWTKLGIRITGRLFGAAFGYVMADFVEEIAEEAASKTSSIQTPVTQQEGVENNG